MTKKTEVVTDVSNDAAQDIGFTVPYIVAVTLRGTADFLFHRYSCDAVAEKAAAKKGSKSKKTDNVESYVYRDEGGGLCLPGEYVRQAIIAAAKFQQDPRSPRKSAVDLFKARAWCARAGMAARGGPARCASCPRCWTSHCGGPGRAGSS